jgi:hypothetical protein
MILNQPKPLDCARRPPGRHSSKSRKPSSARVPHSKECVHPSSPFQLEDRRIGLSRGVLAVREVTKPLSRRRIRDPRDGCRNPTNYPAVKNAQDVPHVVTRLRRRADTQDYGPGDDAPDAVGSVRTKFLHAVPSFPLRGSLWFETLHRSYYGPDRPALVGRDEEFWLN